MDFSWFCFIQSHFILSHRHTCHSIKSVCFNKWHCFLTKVQSFYFCPEINLCRSVCPNGSSCYNAAIMLPTRKISNLAILLHEIDLTSLQKSWILDSMLRGTVQLTSCWSLWNWVWYTLLYVCWSTFNQMCIFTFHIHIQGCILSNYTARNHGLKDCVPVIIN